LKDWLDGRQFRRLLVQLPGAQLSALDIGGGAGRQLTVLKNIDPRITFTQVVDLDDGAAELARVAGHAYFHGRIEDFASDRAFDHVLLLNLIEHVEDPHAVLARVHDLLTPSGVALVKTPNIDSWDARLFRARNWGGYHCPRHWVLFTREGFVKLADAAGLRVLHARYTQGAPFWATSVLFLFEDWGWVSITRGRPAVDHPLYAPLCALFAAFDFIRKPLAKTSQMFCTLARK
jgi:SAM-dependent methyltransferase